MKNKSMYQLLAPFAVTVVWYIVWLILGILVSALWEFRIISERFDYRVWNDAPIGSDYSILFYVIDIILIIIVEVLITSGSDKDFE